MTALWNILSVAHVAIKFFGEARDPTSYSFNLS